MKRKAFAAMMLAAMTWAVSCEQEIKESPEESDHMVIEAVAEGIGSQTKAELAYKYDVVWNEGDQIIVMNYQTGYDTFTLTRGAGTTVGTFKQDGTLDLAGTVLALYPATLWDRERPRWPSRQSMDNLVIPMYCEMSLPRRSRTATFNFSPLGAILQIAFTSHQANVNLESIKIQDGSKSMIGTFDIDSEGQAVIQTSGNGGITLDCGGCPVGLSPKYFNISIPAGKYEDLTLTFTATDGRTCVMKSSTMPEIKLNTVGKISLTGDFSVPEEGVKLWEGGPYWATTNIGAATDTDYGLYFEWGNTIGYAPDGNAFPYSFSSEDSYPNTPGAKLQSDIKTATYDAAQASWGGNWRMPTFDEFIELLKYGAKWYDGVSVQYSGQEVAGYKFTGEGDFSGNSIFLPCAGYGNGHTLIDAGSYGIGDYWTSSYYDNNRAYIIHLSIRAAQYSYGNRSAGYTIRPVHD